MVDTVAATAIPHHVADLSQMDMNVFTTSLCMVGVAELFDKTWFMGLILAFRYSPLSVFVGSFAALFLHTILAAAFGYGFAMLLQPHVLDFLAASLFLIFAVMYSRDSYQADADSDVIASGREEAAEDMGEEETADEVLPTYGAASGKGFPKRARSQAGAILKAFVAVFIAEWGDRTQIAMIGQHASQPLVPVFLGSCVAFFLLTLSAVGAASLLSGQKISERLVYAVSATCFYVFAALSLKDALVAMHQHGKA
jgi:putative Ca2+/H+ antiporter (TMEM165/GDT1 family)